MRNDYFYRLLEPDEFEGSLWDLWKCTMSFQSGLHNLRLRSIMWNYYSNNIIYLSLMFISTTKDNIYNLHTCTLHIFICTYFHKCTNHDGFFFLYLDVISVYQINLNFLIKHPKLYSTFFLYFEEYHKTAMKITCVICHTVDDLRCFNNKVEIHNLIKMWIISKGSFLEWPFLHFQLVEYAKICCVCESNELGSQNKQFGILPILAASFCIGFSTVLTLSSSFTFSTGVGTSIKKVKHHHLYFFK